MIPFLLAAAGGYLIAQSQSKDTFAKGGDVSDLNDKVLEAQREYIKQRNIIKGLNIVGSQIGLDEFERFLREQLSAKNLVSKKILSPKYIDYHFSFINSKSFGRSMRLDEAKSFASRLNEKGYKTIIVPSVVVNINSDEPSMGYYNIYTDTPVSSIELKNMGIYSDGGMLYKESFAKGGRTDAKTVRNLMNDIKDTYDHDSLVTFVEMPDTPVLKEVTDEYVVIKFPMITGYSDGGMLYKESFAKGGSTDGGMTKPSAKRIANKLMKIDSDIWDELNIESGSQLYADDELQKKYARELEKSGADEMINQVDAKKVFDILEDNNYHSVNQYFIYRGVLGKGKRDVYVNMYNDGASYMLMNPNLIQPK